MAVRAIGDAEDIVNVEMLVFSVLIYASAMECVLSMLTTNNAISDMTDVAYSVDSTSYV